MSKYDKIFSIRGCFKILFFSSLGWLSACGGEGIGGSSLSSTVSSEASSAVAISSENSSSSLVASSSSSEAAELQDNDLDGVTDANDLCPATPKIDIANGLIDNWGCSPFQVGESNYRQKGCFGCHGDNGDGGRGGPLNLGESCRKTNCSDVAELAPYIDRAMPLNPGDCVGDCATTLAVYIVREFNTNTGTDSDNDGIPSPADLCPSTPAVEASAVSTDSESLGCSISDLSVDSDGDTVPDFSDRCPNTVAGEVVGTSGCSFTTSLDMSPLSSPQIRLLKNEYIAVIKGAFNEDELPSVVLPSDSDDGVFTNNAKEDTVADYEPFLISAESYATYLAGKIAPTCDFSANTAQCVSDKLVGPMLGLYRMASAPPQDIGELEAIITDMLAKNATQQVAVSAAITRMLVDDRFLFRIEVGETSISGNTLRLTDVEMASRLSFLLTSMSPDEALKNATNGLATNPNLIVAQGERLMDTAAFDQVAWRFMAEWLGVEVNKPPSNPLVTVPQGDQCDTTAQCKTLFGDNASDCSNSASAQSVCMCGNQRCDMGIAPAEQGLGLEESMYEETKRFVEYVLQNDNVPFSELFSANYSFLNNTMAEAYGLPAPAQDWQQVVFPPESKRGGILTHASFLTAHASGLRDVNWIYRGNAVYERLLCEHLPPPPIDAAETEVESRETTAPCSNCHQLVDPIGRLFDVYDENGMLRNDSGAGWVSIGSDLDGSYTGAPDFASALSTSPSLTSCAVKMWYRFALGRLPNVTEVESFNKTLNSLESTGSLKSMIKTFLSTGSFQSVSTEDNSQSCQAR